MPRIEPVQEVDDDTLVEYLRSNGDSTTPLMILEAAEENENSMGAVILERAREAAEFIHEYGGKVGLQSEGLSDDTNEPGYVAIFDRNLTDSEVQEIFTGTDFWPTAFEEPGVIRSEYRLYFRHKDSTRTTEYTRH